MYLPIETWIVSFFGSFLKWADTKKITKLTIEVHTTINEKLAATECKRFGSCCFRCRRRLIDFRLRGFRSRLLQCLIFSLVDLMREVWYDTCIFRRYLYLVRVTSPSSARCLVVKGETAVRSMNVRSSCLLV